MSKINIHNLISIFTYIYIKELRCYVRKTKCLVLFFKFWLRNSSRKFFTRASKNLFLPLIVIYERNVKDLYQNTEIALRIFVSTPATNCIAKQGRTQGEIFRVQTPP
jgi:hypothetical protein